MKKWLLASVAVLCASMAQAQPAPWPGQCPAGTLPTAIGCQPAAATPSPTDLVLGWQTGQNPSTRSMQIQQLTAETTRVSRAALQAMGYFYAADFGMKADGTTSDDAAMQALAIACTAKGGIAFLPTGRIKLDGTGSVTSLLKNCNYSGAGILAGLQGDNASMGTLFLLTSTTVKPFNIASHWKMSGVGFYWPNQITGLTAYPFLMSATTPTTTTNSWTLDNVVIINAYNGIQAAGGAFFIDNSLMYATNELFEIANIGDSFKVNNVHFTPGPWFQMTGFASQVAMDAVTNQNMIFRFMGGGGVPIINIQLGNSASFAWRYGIVVEPGVTVAQSSFHWMLDGMGTIVKMNGGVWGPGNIMSGGGICFHVNTANPNNRGNAPCFNLGSGSQFSLVNWSGNSAGSFIESGGSNVDLVNVKGSVGNGDGASGDGGDYYGIHTTTNPGGLVISVKDSVLNGSPGDIHRHGITTDVAASRLIVQNSAFMYLNDALNVQSANGTTLITGNWSINTAGAESIVSATMASSGVSVIYANNQFDKPAKAVASACGTGCVTNSVFSGFIQIGTGTVTSGTLTLPWASAGSACNFWLNGSGPAVSATVVSSRVWNWTTAGAVDVAGRQLFYACPVQ